MPEARRPSTRFVITGTVIAVVIIVAIIIVASRGDDSDSTSSAATTTSGFVIQSPATVTGITGVTDASDSTGSSVAAGTATTGPANTYPLVRTLVATGKFDCTALGSWQPFAEIQIALPVGEPAANLTCGDTVLDLPEGFCTEACSEVPADWKVVEDPGVTPQALMLIVAPTEADSNTAQFMCIKDFVPQLKQILPAATSIADACSSATSNSVEIPYVPPVTSDIPYVPPPVSVDIPSSSG